MKILYYTLNVLGSNGANAAELFPKLAVNSDYVDHVYVADYEANKAFIQKNQCAEFLKMRRNKGAWLRNAVRIARKCSREKVDVLHFFYRQSTVLNLIVIKLFFLIYGCRTKVLLDHRSVDLSIGINSKIKKIKNFGAQLGCDMLAGNPYAVETNHFYIFKKKEVIDLGYDSLPEISEQIKYNSKQINFWYVASLMPKNRKTEFLLDVFDEINKALTPEQRAVTKIWVAGSGSPYQVKRLNDNPIVHYFGRVDRKLLYMNMAKYPGFGIAYMNRNRHEFAPSIKFAEYAALKFQIVASSTTGLKLQALRMNISNVNFVEQEVDAWVKECTRLINEGYEPANLWKDQEMWSYRKIFDLQVMELYQSLIQERSNEKLNSN